jgi:hypothetical protein
MRTLHGCHWLTPASARGFYDVEYRARSRARFGPAVSILQMWESTRAKH